MDLFCAISPPSSRWSRSEERPGRCGSRSHAEERKGQTGAPKLPCLKNGAGTKPSLRTRAVHPKSWCVTRVSHSSRSLASITAVTKGTKYLETGVFETHRCKIAWSEPKQRTPTRPWKPPGQIRSAGWTPEEPQTDSLHFRLAVRASRHTNGRISSGRRACCFLCCSLFDGESLLAASSSSSITPRCRVHEWTE